MGSVRNLFVQRGDVEQVAYIWAIPELWERPGTVLYVGANPIRFHCGPELHAADHEITLLEIWPENCEAFRGCEMVAHIVQGDVREVDGLNLPHGAYDITVWWHGPEHIAFDEVAPTLEKIEALTRRAVVLGCPWGEYPHGQFKNPHEAHLCVLYPADLEALGYETHEIGQPDDVETGRLVAWKIV